MSSISWKIRVCKRILFVSTVVIVFFVGCDQQPNEPEGTTPAVGNPPFETKLANGTTVELVGISTLPNTDGIWWRPDGILLAEAPYDKLEEELTFAGYGFLFRLIASRDSSYRWKIPGSRQNKTYKVLNWNGEVIQDLLVRAAYLPGDESSADVRVGVASGAWKANAKYSRFRCAVANGFAGGGAIFHPPFEEEGRSSFIVAHTFPELQARLVAIEKDGEVIGWPGGNIMTVRGMQTLSCWFDLPLTKLKQLLFQTREYNWCEFQNVSLQVGRRTQVLVKLVSGLRDTKKQNKHLPVLRAIDNSGVGEPTNLEIGSLATDFEAKTLDGLPLKLSDFRGKYILLDFWATWCKPCIEETPCLKNVYEAFGRDPRFVMIGLSLDASAEAPKKYVQKNGLEWIQGHLGDWSTTKVPANYGVQGIPAIFLIGPDGKFIAENLRGPAIKRAVSEALSAGSQ